MASLNVEEVKELALKYALANAVKYGGKADARAVMSKIMGERKDLRPFARDVLKIVQEVVEYVNSLSLEQQRQILQERWPEMLEEKKVETKKGIETLPPLPNDDKYSLIVLRFAPNPDFVLTLGNARPAILNYAYKIRYENLGKKAKFLLRFEDTDPKIKRPFIDDPQVRERYSEKELLEYKFILDDLEWLGIRPDEVYIQSDRVVEGVYYKIAEELIRKGLAYVCTCPDAEWKKYRDEGRPCPCRDKSPEEHLERWQKMLNGEYREGEAVVRIKTDLSHPDPSVRDWVALRIVETPHPRLVLKYGEEKARKYRVWPTYNFAVAVDDHFMGVTHVLRAQEHAVNTVKQSYVFKHMGWTQPETIHFGRLMIEGGTLSKSKLKALGLRYDDPRLPTLAGLRERGILPDTIWEIMLHVGIKPTDAKISLENVYSINRKYLDQQADRYMAVIEPVKLIITNIDKDTLVAKIPYHPSKPERGHREIRVPVRNGEAVVYISRNDAELLVKKGKLRLMELANIELVEVREDVVIAKLHSYDINVAKKEKMDIVQWVPEDSVKLVVERVDKTPLTSKDFVIEEGLAEKALLSLSSGTAIQLVRYGFVKVLTQQDGTVRVRYIHD